MKENCAECRFESNDHQEAQRIIDMFFDAGARISVKHYNELLSILARIEARAEKRVSKIEQIRCDEMVRVAIETERLHKN